MFPHPIKSKSLKLYSVVQTISRAIQLCSFCFSRKTKAVSKPAFSLPSLSVNQSGKRSVISIYPLVAVVVTTLLFVSCQKEALTDPALNSTTSDDLSASAKTVILPKVNAGHDRVVVYPSSKSTTLSGSGSDSKSAVSFQWKQVNGAKATISQSNKPTATISNLKPGLYKFVLTVTNSLGISNSDTVIVSVLQRVTWTIEGVTREALVHPASGNASSAPVLIAFHGHGGEDSTYAAKQFELSWPNAVIVYPQGLRTKSGTDKLAKLAGWQNSVGEVNTRTGIKDQDIKFFDAMLSTLKKNYNANLNYVFVHGWSNGGEFIYNVLWSARTTSIAGLAPAGASLGTKNGKKPMPVIHTAGKQDDKISFSRQQQSVQSDKAINQCASGGSVWATGPEGLLGTQYHSKVSATVVMLQYDGGHIFPSTIPPQIVNFFKDIVGQ